MQCSIERCAVLIYCKCEATSKGKMDTKYFGYPHCPAPRISETGDTFVEDWLQSSKTNKTEVIARSTRGDKFVARVSATNAVDRQSRRTWGKSPHFVVALFLGTAHHVGGYVYIRTFRPASAHHHYSIPSSTSTLFHSRRSFILLPCIQSVSSSLLSVPLYLCVAHPWALGSPTESPSRC